MLKEMKKTAIISFVAGILATTAFLHIKDKLMEFIYPENSIRYSSNLTRQEINKNRKELEYILGDGYEERFSEKYNKFLKYKESLELARVLEKEGCFSNYGIDDYIALLKTGKSVELVKELESRFRADLCNEYTLLLNNGLPLNIIGSMDRFYVTNLAKDLKDNPIPEEFLKYFSFNGCDNSIKAAAHNPVLGADTKKIQEYLQNQLNKIEQIDREKSDYTENSSKISNIKNINTLYLIKEYVDYFEDPNNLKDITRMLDEDLNDPFSEHGGVIIFEDNKYNFKTINPAKKDLKNLEDNVSYKTPAWTKYVGCLGDFHLHATTEDDSEYAGPSMDGGILFGGDLAALESETDRNAYRMNCVITKLKGDKFNVDIYFKDVISWHILGSNSAYSTGRGIVLDLGVYDMIRD
ncbi:MAG: hypothetical protein PHH54_05760 [Candidatus Nanoarchaeia archaeon]|nr:hypothetical protein [Candidatus Nanoarchaeia archaeon]MDD5741461.1 hypothetical protein [Candidatus Nanoarchaeia archaeon]